MVAELRAVQADLAARTKFAGKDGTVRETRGVIADLLPRDEPTEEEREIRTVRTASRMGRAFNDGFIEVG